MPTSSAGLAVSAGSGLLIGVDAVGCRLLIDALLASGPGDLPLFDVELEVLGHLVLSVCPTGTKCDLRVSFRRPAATLAWSFANAASVATSSASRVGPVVNKCGVAAHDEAFAFVVEMADLCEVRRHRRRRWPHHPADHHRARGDARRAGGRCVGYLQRFQGKWPVCSALP